MPFDSRADTRHTVDRCLEWYNVQREAAQRLFSTVRTALTHGLVVDVRQFNGMTMLEFNTATTEHFQELEHLAAMDMFSAAEASLWRDYRHKGLSLDADPLSVALRQLYARKGPRFYDLAPVLQIWKTHTAAPQPQYISDYKGALYYRHWLAHGRHWDLGGERYLLTKVADICNRVVAAVGAPVPTSAVGRLRGMWRSFWWWIGRVFRR